MNILYLADHNSIHDVRWINFFADKEGVRCFVIFRSVHKKNIDVSQNLLRRQVTLLAAIEDPSTVRPWRNFLQSFRLKRLIESNKIHLLHILYAEPNSLWVNWKWLFRTPVIVTTRGTDILKTIPSFFCGKSFLDKIIARQYRKALREADHLTCTSLSQLESLNRMGIDRFATIVRTGISVELIRTSNRDVAKVFGIRKPFVLMPRSMRPLYNHEFTLDAISILPRQIRDEFTFVFVNADTQDRNYFEYIKRKADGVASSIIFIESLVHADLISLIKQSSLVVMNPHSDGSPVSAMEAIACEIPVILPPLTYDKVVFGEAFTFDSWRVESLRDMILKVLAMSHNSRTDKIRSQEHQVLINGNIDIEMMKVYRIYEELINGIGE